MSDPVSDAALDSFATFGELLKHLRQRARLTQDEFGLAVGYSRAHVARLESGQRTPDVSAVRARFVEALNLRDEPALATRLVELAATAHVQPPANETVSPEPEPLPRVPNNLPVPLTSFIGRERELADLRRLLPTARLLTLTGSGGVGKTRLALQLAAEVMGTYPDGVWLVELAPLTDPARVPHAVAAVLGVREQASGDILATLLGHLRDRALLLLLDNCEHLVDACAQLADVVLRGSHRVHILASSRQALGIGGELAWRVPSLPAPDPAQHLPPAEASQYPAVRLFLDRAAYAQPAFTLTDANALAVEQIVHRLDGIPLAIELAAARVKVMTAEQIAARLDDRFRLLIGGSRTALPRQQTLRGAIDWSYGLLSEPERVLLRRLAVFMGGWTLEAAEAIHGDGVLELLDQLVSKSLVLAEERTTGMRFALLETIRQYAREKLTDSDEGPRVRDRHLDYFARLAEDAAPALHKGVTAAFGRLELEIDNVRAALGWAREADRTEDGLRLAAAFYEVWFVRISHAEGLAWLVAVTSRAQAPPVNSLPWLRAYLALVDAHRNVGDARSATEMAEKALPLAEALGSPAELGLAYRQYAYALSGRGEHAAARAYYEKALAITAALGDKYGMANAYDDIADAWADEGDLARAEWYWEQAVTQDPANLMMNAGKKRRWGYRLLGAGNPAGAREKFRESLLDNAAASDKKGVGACLAAFGALALAWADLPRAAQLFGASEALHESIRSPMYAFDLERYRRDVAALREELDEATFQAAWAAGRALDYQQAIDYALATAPGSA